MLKVLRIIIISFPVLWTNCLCQSISHQVLVPGAGLATNGNITLSQTIGEVMIKTTGDSYYILTQGFQQPKIVPHITIPDDSGVRVFPNPVTDFVTIEIIGKDARTFKIEFLDLTGRTLISAKKTFGNDYWYREQYNVKEMVSGFYMVRIMSEDGLFCRTFRIQKI
jgi:hypothetical protein